VIRTEFIENGISGPTRYHNLLAIRIAIDADASPTINLPWDRSRSVKALIRSVDRESQFLGEIDQHADQMSQMMKSQMRPRRILGNQSRTIAQNTQRQLVKKGIRFEYPITGGRAS
jgi:hypothetical protein